MIGNEEDFTACLGFEVEGVDEENITGIDISNFKGMIGKAVSEFPNFKATATTLREVHTASDNDWAALAWHDGEFYSSTNRESLEIFDRVGGGDSFASGLIYGFLEFNDAAKAVEWGAAHGGSWETSWRRISPRRPLTEKYLLWLRVYSVQFGLFLLGLRINF